MTQAQYRSYLAGKCKCAVCGQPGALQVFELTDRPIAELAWTDLQAFCAASAECARELVAEGTVVFENNNNHSRFAILKAAIKRRRFGRHDISRREIAKLQAKPLVPPLVVPFPLPRAALVPPSAEQMVEFGAAK